MNDALAQAIKEWKAFRSVERDDILSYYLRDVIEDNDRRGIHCAGLKAALNLLEEAGKDNQ